MRRAKALSIERTTGGTREKGIHIIMAPAASESKPTLKTVYETRVGRRVSVEEKWVRCSCSGVFQNGKDDKKKRLNSQ